MSEPAPGPADPTPDPSGTVRPPAPDQGFLPPDEAYRQAAPAFTAADDPLVNPAEQRISGWAHRIGMVLRRSWRPLATIFLLTHALPAIAFGALTLGGSIGLDALDLRRLVTYGDQRRVIGVLIATVLAYLVVVLPAQMLGYAAATHHATRQAAGLTVSIGQSLRFGLRRFLGLAAYQVVAYVLVGVAVLAVAMCCVGGAEYLGLVPTGLVYAYLAMATALVGPAYLFGRGNPVGSSFRLLHAAFWPTAARLFLLGLAILASAFVETMISGIGEWLSGSLGVVPAAPLAFTAAALAALVEVPLTMLLFSGILITYAERLAAERGVDTNDLVAWLC
ncbi:hypothetical protein [Catellatospora sp. NPDC049609]|uniref:hypothetical protein n=1 Tax=Catellatospora sp. NPDC049609 TaxID=3155505 RepID=UPI0034371A83